MKPTKPEYHIFSEEEVAAQHEAMDRVVARIDAGEFDDKIRITKLESENAKLRERLRLAEAVCESINEFHPHDGPYWDHDALEAWRKSK